MLTRLMDEKFHCISRLVDVLCLFLLISCFLSACGVTSFEEGKVDREKVVDLILDGSVEIAESGLVTLPTEMKDLSDTGVCSIVEFNGQSGIYFYDTRGALGESSGYIFVTDRIHWEEYVNEDEYTGSCFWVEIEEIETNWFSVKTG